MNFTETFARVQALVHQHSDDSAPIEALRAFVEGAFVRPFEENEQKAAVLATFALLRGIEYVSPDSTLPAFVRPILPVAELTAEARAEAREMLLALGEIYLGCDGDFAPAVKNNVEIAAALGVAAMAVALFEGEFAE